MNQLDIDHRAISAGLLMPPAPLDEEPRLTDAGLFFMLGAMAYDIDGDEEACKHRREAMKRVLCVAKKAGEFNDRHEELLYALFSEGVDPLSTDDRGKLLLVLCRLVAVSVGPGRVGSLIGNEVMQ